MFLFTLLGLILFGTGSGDSEMPKMNFEQHFKALSTVRHPSFEDGRPWREGREYVKSKMAFYGLGPIIQEQVFNATVDSEEVQGVNLIGIEEGADPRGPIIVVGADYATARTGSPLKDNTGGVACFLETIHIYHDRVAYNPNFKNFSVIFVAFDLNTKEYRSSGNTKPGSYIFVKDWLLPYLQQTFRQKQFLGAIILDSVTTYNHLNETQRLPEGFEKMMPNAYKNITDNGLKGNFIGLLYRNIDAENGIRSTFFQKYNMDRKMRPYRLQEMEMDFQKQYAEEDVVSMVNHQAHYHFWILDMPAFLLFDTDTYRTNPVPDACTVVGCNVDEFLTKGRIDFMTKTTQTVVATLLELQTTPYEVISAAANPGSFPLLLMTSLSFLCAMIVKY